MLLLGEDVEELLDLGVLLLDLGVLLLDALVQDVYLRPEDVRTVGVIVAVVYGTILKFIVSLKNDSGVINNSVPFNHVAITSQ